MRRPAVDRAVGGSRRWSIVLAVATSLLLTSCGDLGTGPSSDAGAPDPGAEVDDASAATTVDEASPTSATVPTETVVRALTPDEVARAESLLIEAEDCPVGFDQLRMLEVPHWDFDGVARTGTVILNADVADDVGGVFEQLFEASFPIQRVEAIDPNPPDETSRFSSNITVGFKCRSVRNGSSWSEHAYGRAIDINPVDNPNVSASGEAVPPLGADRVDRSLQEPGMIHEGGVVTQAFDAIGWEWGGRWTSHQDYMHFSVNGR